MFESAMRGSKAVRIAIVGGSLTGALLCMRLLRSSHGPFSIALYEKQPQRFCRGVAYSSSLPYQLLNVPAGKMSLFLEAPDDFVHWLEVRGGRHKPEDFVPRRLFGDYLCERFAQALAAATPHEFIRIDSEVVDLVPVDEGLRIEAANAQARMVDRVYLCTGNFPPGELPGMDLSVRESGRYIASPWDGSYLRHVGKEDTVLVVGTGLSMIDQVMSLQERPDFAGQVIAMSRRGLLPLPHGSLEPYRLSTSLPSSPTARGLAQWLQNEIHRAEQSGSCFRAVIEALRPQIPILWSALPLRERKRFMRHLRPFWEIHRHRIPQPTAERLQHLIAADKLRVLAGRISGLTLTTPDTLRIDYVPRGQTQPQQLSVNWVINCTGPQTDQRQLPSPLYHALCARALVQRDASGLGVLTTLQGEAIRSDGEVERRLVLVGPPAKATLWESTALQEIRHQVHLLVNGLEQEFTTENVA